MPQDKNRQFLDFEKPIRDLFEDIEKLKQTADKSKVDMSDSIGKLEAQVIERRRQITTHLTPWQKVQLSRHPDRPYTKKYIEHLFTDFVELFGDRTVRDDKAMVGGFASLDGNTVMVIGQQKGSNTKMRQLRNFGMANPEGYRKALRLMKLAEKFNKPVITFIDTPGAYPGIEAEERGQGEAIARNIYEMIRLKVPVICVIIGEGASGGALGIGVGDRIFMLENAWYTVISPENCSSILWRSWDQKEKAAEQLKLTPDHMYDFRLIDSIVPEPLGGAHWDYRGAANLLKPYLVDTLNELKMMDPAERVKKRIEKFTVMGFWDEVDDNEQVIVTHVPKAVGIEAPQEELLSPQIELSIDTSSSSEIQASSGIPSSPEIPSSNETQDQFSTEINDPAPVPPVSDEELAQADENSQIQAVQDEQVLADQDGQLQTDQDELQDDQLNESPEEPADLLRKEKAGNNR